ncbi:hypothetical protein BP6252_05782 [Coleophoma cylindrospora]|uniref:Acetyl-CoA synthetase-like protein n=1 Tax=Coleophoma cylindrospora TaxID=1849047 RepID=A0A3D8RUH8_9HELO|nr:hypothetical protein BP6252_05782 [Coleophoma cylindrospora]
MSSKPAEIEIPESDIWGTLFKRSQKPFPDDQVIYQCPITNRNYIWSALRTATEQFGSGLQTRWAWKKGDVLALFASNCIDTPAVTWGCHYAGGIVSPANPAYNIRELTHHLKDSGAKAIVTKAEFLPVASRAAKDAGIPNERVILIGDEVDDNGVFKHFTEIMDKSVTKKQVAVKADKDLAFLVYSSGTTGLPKGVMLTHRNVLANLFMVASTEGRLLSWNQDNILSVLPYYHIYGLQFLVHMPAYSGVTSVVMPSFDLKLFCDIIQNHKITYAYVAPPIILHLAKSPVISSYDISSLKTITSGAAPLSKDLIRAVHARFGIEVKQAYGLSETSPATHLQVKWDDGLGSVGKALPNQIIKFMSPEEEEVPKGKEGEIWVSGPNVFVGYLNNPTATKASITPDGFFKTGDVGYEDANGNLFITDRVKELIKYKGFQVAPAELEGILASNKFVDDAAVIGIMDESLATEVPVAFLVPKQGVPRTDKNKKKVVEWLNGKVASHKKLRGGVRWIDEIPKSASGKILRRVLKDVLIEEGKKPKAKL